MNILLIKPPLNPNLLIPNHDEPLELEYLAAAAREQRVEILDMRIDKNLMKKLGTFRPDMVGITAYSCDVKYAKNVLQEVKKYNGRIKTVIGGHHATLLPHDFAVPFVDAIFLGASDFSFREFVGVMSGGGDAESVNNIALVKENGLHFTGQVPFDQNLDLLPLPARHLTLQYRKNYRDSMKNQTGLILTSRGCPYRCNFCACWKIMDGKYVARSPESIVEEFAGLPDDIDLVCFADDNTLHSQRRVRRFIELIKARRIKKRFMMYARADTIVNYPGLIESLKDIGLEYLLVGIESFRDDELNRMNKKTSVQINNQAIRILRELGVGISPHLMVNPNYTREDFRQLFKYVCDTDLFRPVFTVLTPLPGTDLYDENQDHIVIKDYDYFDFTHSIFPTKLNRKEFYSEYANLYKKSYSFRRFFKNKFKNWRSFLKKSQDLRPSHPDRLSFYQMLFLHVYGIPVYFKVKNIYKSEPIIEPQILAGL